MEPKNPMAELMARNFPSAQGEALTLKPDERYAGPDSAHCLAFNDEAFRLREGLRSLRRGRNPLAACGWPGHGHVPHAVPALPRGPGGRWQSA